mmetsp:Transcript_13106/g.37406  ORF Transcript_13106/g.37406 Transcript_13106/m.37406 type:complete len:89 (+) Transcript_13106:1733-1999(+)
MMRCPPFTKTPVLNVAQRSIDQKTAAVQATIIAMVVWGGSKACSGSQNTSRHTNVIAMQSQASRMLDDGSSIKLPVLLKRLGDRAWLN